MARKLRSRWSLEACEDMQRTHGMTDGTFEYISPVKWYQIWRWKEIFNPSRSYLKSRLGELELAEKLAECIKESL